MVYLETISRTQSWFSFTKKKKKMGLDKGAREIKTAVKLDIGVHIL